MIERIAIALAVAACCAAALLAVRVYLDWRRSRAVLPVAVAAPVGVPTLAYLYTAECSLCPQQARVVDALATRHPDDLRVLRIDALAEPELADRYGVWTVPATVVADATGRTVAVNCGLTSAAKLERQVASAMDGSSDADSASPREPARAA